MSDVVAEDLPTFNDASLGDVAALLFVFLCTSDPIGSPKGLAMGYLRMK